MTDLPRDRWERPLIQPVNGGDLVPYVRASGLGDVLDDPFHLERWKQRMVAIGVAGRRDLVLAVNAHREDKAKLNRLVVDAMAAAQSNARATIGTAMHGFAETVDRGNDPGYIPDEFAPDLDAYLALTEPLFEHVAIEQFCVCDELQTAGTPDRVSRLKTPLFDEAGVERLPAGVLAVLDEKTGTSLKFSAIPIAVQLAVYAHSKPYSPDTGRFEWPGPVRADWALVVHSPAGAGTAELFWVDLVAGWELAHLAVEVRAARKRKDLLQPVSLPGRLPDIEEWAS